jgi:hypothetical protein
MNWKEHERKQLQSKKYHENLHQENWCPNWDSNQDLLNIIQLPKYPQILGSIVG